MELNEHFINIWNNDVDNKKKYYDEVISILERTYEPIGGLISLGGNKEEIMSDEYFWKLVTRNGKVVAVSLYKTSKGGRKLALGGTDGTPQGKQDFYSILKSDIDEIKRGVWGEVSGAMEHIYLDKLGGKTMPKELSQLVLKYLKKEASFEDDTHYTRSIGGKERRKILVGNAPKDVDDDIDDYLQKHLDK